MHNYHYIFYSYFHVFYSILLRAPSEIQRYRYVLSKRTHNFVGRLIKFTA